METLDDLYHMAQAYAYAQTKTRVNTTCVLTRMDYAERFALQYVTDWKTWQDNVTDHKLPFVPPDDYFRTYIAINPDWS